MLANDVDPDATPPLSNTGVTAVSLDTGATSGTVTLGTDGSFTYEPAPGFTGLDTFTYTARDADSLDSVETGIVSVTVGADCIWFIDNTPAGAGNMGTLSDPFSTIAALNTAQGTASGPQAGDLILLFTGSYTTGANLLASQRFIGQGIAPATAVANAGITLAPFSSGLPAAGARPTVSSTDNGIDLASGNTVRGLDIGNTTLFGLAGTGVGTSTVNTLAISGTGGALSIATGTLAVSLDSITSTSSTGDGISLSNVGGSFAVTGSTAVSNSLFDGIDISNSAASFTFPTVAIDGTGGLGVRLTSNTGPVTFAAGSIGATNDPAGNAVGISGGTANVTVGATINSDTARAVEVTNRMGGAVTFSAAIDEDGTGINLTSNAGGTISFSGGMTLDTGSSTAFNATGGGTINVTGVNTIGASTALDGTAVNIADTVIGTGGVTFRSISVDQSPAGGTTAAAIILDDTGTGAFTITGTGTTDGSGGTIQDVVEDAIRLFNTDGAVSISNMIIEDIGNTGSAAPGHHGVDGQQVDGGLTLDNVTIQRVTDSAIHGEAPGGGSTTWNGLTLTDSKLQFANRFHLAGIADGGGADEAMVTIEGISGTVLIRNNDFDDGPGFVNLFTASSGTVDITVETNTFDDGRKDLAGVPSVGSSGVRVNTTGTIDADIRIGGDPNSATSTKGNTFLNTGSDIGRVRVATDSNIGVDGASGVDAHAALAHRRHSGQVLAPIVEGVGLDGDVYRPARGGEEVDETRTVIEIVVPDQDRAADSLDGDHGLVGSPAIGNTREVEAVCELQLAVGQSQSVPGRRAAAGSLAVNRAVSDALDGDVVESQAAVDLLAVHAVMPGGSRAGVAYVFDDHVRNRHRAVVSEQPDRVFDHILDSAARAVGGTRAGDRESSGAGVVEDDRGSGGTPGRALIDADAPKGDASGPDDGIGDVDGGAVESSARADRVDAGNVDRAATGGIESRARTGIEGHPSRKADRATRVLVKLMPVPSSSMAALKVTAPPIRFVTSTALAVSLLIVAPTVTFAVPPLMPTAFPAGSLVAPMEPAAKVTGPVSGGQPDSKAAGTVDGNRWKGEAGRAVRDVDPIKERVADCRRSGDRKGAADIGEERYRRQCSRSR